MSKLSSWLKRNKKVKPGVIITAVATIAASLGVYISPEAMTVIKTVLEIFTQ